MMRFSTRPPPGIPIGVEFGDDERQEIPEIPSATQWTAVSDLAGKMFYYKTMREGTIKRVDLDQIDFDSGSESASTLDKGGFTFADVTPKRQRPLPPDSPGPRRRSSASRWAG